MKGYVLKNKTLLIFVMFACLWGAVLLSPGVCLAKENVKILFDVTPEAQITALEYFLAPWKGADRMHFKITLKNLSSESKRFRVFFFLDEGDSGAMPFPIKPKKKGMEPLIKPQDEVTQTLPLVFKGLSKSFTIKVAEF